MKKVNLFLDDDQHERLVAKKGKMTWVDFVMQLVDKER